MRSWSNDVIIGTASGNIFVFFVFVFIQFDHQQGRPPLTGEVRYHISHTHSHTYTHSHTNNSTRCNSFKIKHEKDVKKKCN